MARVDALIGQRFGELLVLAVSPKSTRSKRYYECQCNACGERSHVLGTILLRGDLSVCIECTKKRNRSVEEQIEELIAKLKENKEDTC